MTLKLLLIFLAFQSTGYGFWRNSDDPKQLLIHSKKLIANELNRCSPKSRFTEEDLTRIMGKNLRRHWNALRMDLLTKANEEDYSKMESCLNHVHHHLQKLHRQLRKAEKNGNEKRSHRNHHQDGVSRTEKLSRNSRSLDSSTSELIPHQVEHPIDLTQKQLEWMGLKEKATLQRFRRTNPTKWEILIKTGQIFYHSRKDIRKKSQKSLEEYCKTNLGKLIGEENLQEIKEMLAESATVEKIEAKFAEIVGELTNEKDRTNAEHYGQFCRKVFRIVHFKPGSIIQWLNSNQKMQIMGMIQDPNIGDGQVYDKIFDFYNSTTGDARETAREMIDNGCRRFIAHTFGEDVEEEIDVALQHGNSSKQQLAAKLAIHGEQIQDDRSRKLVVDSLPICTRIYIGFDYSCECNGKSDECHPSTYTCINCGGNTFGIQCEQCLDGYQRTPTGDCANTETSDTNREQEDENEKPQKKCECNGHSETCSKLGKCLNCDDNTDGDRCEMCIPGYYGDPRAGTSTDCTPCPCPDNGECQVNDSGLVECLQCPADKTGITCEKDVKKDSKEEKEERNRF
ncbi:unnamed protein product, partial [Mesorhabditis belari]|uniref:Laminin EGF-like domain-containing protein n=1 Tax=Mesorhabditis belari TaxID=2138241 RepID=A0AAF3EKF3_9BILA